MNGQDNGQNDMTPIQQPQQGQQPMQPVQPVQPQQQQMMAPQQPMQPMQQQMVPQQQQQMVAPPQPMQALMQAPLQAQQPTQGPWAQPGQQQMAPPPEVATQPNMIEISPANIPGNRRYDFEISLSEVKDKIVDGVMKGYVVSYNFKVLSGEYQGQTLRQWYPSYAATSKIRKLFEVCGKTLEQHQGPQGTKEALDPTSLEGAMINAQLDYDKKDFARISDPKPMAQAAPAPQPVAVAAVVAPPQEVQPVQPVQPVQAQPVTPGGFNPQGNNPFGS